MTTSSFLHPDRLLPAQESLRDVARDLFAHIADAPIISPHGHVPVEWFAPDFRFGDATDILIRPDHYVLRMFASQGFRYEDLGVAGKNSTDVADSRTAFRTFAANYDLFLGTPTRLWMDHALYETLGVSAPLSARTADAVYDEINAALAGPEFSPRLLYQRFGMEILATTDTAICDLEGHKTLAGDPMWNGRVVPTFRPDSITDPEHRDFEIDMAALSEITGEDVTTWRGYLAAIRLQRDAFRKAGATATDHGFLTPEAAELSKAESQALLSVALSGKATKHQAQTFRAMMLFEMARMSCDDGLVMQIHAGSLRNYAPSMLDRFGLDRGYDIPQSTNWTAGLKPLLDAFGFDRRLRIILYTLDETTYGRELAPLAGAFPVLTLGAPWWFFDSPMGISRQFDAVIETAGFQNLAGFVDDTRALLSIPARHDVYRRMVASKLAGMVGDRQLTMAQAEKLADDLAVNLVRKAYRLGAATNTLQRTA